MTFFDKLHIFVEKYIVSYEFISLLLVILIMLLKLVVNQKLTELRIKQMIVSMPSEMIFLVLGFLFSNLITKKSADNKAIALCIVVALILIIIQYIIESYLHDKLSGKLGFNIFLILLLYFFSIIFYIIIVYGGVYK